VDPAHIQWFQVHSLNNDIIIWQLCGLESMLEIKTVEAKYINVRIDEILGILRHTGQHYFRKIGDWFS
jgi:hypothetical protein